MCLLLKLVRKQTKKKEQKKKKERKRIVFCNTFHSKYYICLHHNHCSEIFIIVCVQLEVIGNAYATQWFGFDSPSCFSKQTFVLLPMYYSHILLIHTYGDTDVLVIHIHTESGICIAGHLCWIWSLKVHNIMVIEKKCYTQRKPVNQSRIPWNWLSISHICLKDNNMVYLLAGTITMGCYHAASRISY